MIGADGDVRTEHLSELKYTFMVIYEALRLFPPLKYVARQSDDDIDLGKVLKTFLCSK